MLPRPRCPLSLHSVQLPARPRSLPPTPLLPIAATVVVLALLPMEPMMLHAPQRMFGPMVETANAELRQYVAAEGSGRLKFKGGGTRGAVLVCACLAGCAGSSS